MAITAQPTRRAHSLAGSHGGGVVADMDLEAAVTASGPRSCDRRGWRGVSGSLTYRGALEEGMKEEEVEREEEEEEEALNWRGGWGCRCTPAVVASREVATAAMALVSAGALVADTVCAVAATTRVSMCQPASSRGCGIFVTSQEVCKRAGNT